MGGDHHNHEPPFKVPDWRIYQVEDSPELYGVQRALASCGLKDPWLRNEVWRYTQFREVTLNRMLYHCFRRGLKWGFAAAVVTTIVEKVFFGGHGHGHDEHESAH